MEIKRIEYEFYQLYKIIFKEEENEYEKRNTI